MTAEALLCRQYLGWKRNDPKMIAGADYVSVHPLAYGEGNQNVYYWYYATQVMAHVGGEAWQRWIGRLHPLLVNSQVRQGTNDGSWVRDPA